MMEDVRGKMDETRAEVGGLMSEFHFPSLIC